MSNKIGYILVKTNYAKFALNFALLLSTIPLGLFAALGAIAIYHTVILLLSGSWTTLFSFVIPAVTLVLATCVIIVSHPVHSLLNLIAVFFNTVLLFIAVQAEFLALTFLIVYVGAIAILFLFVIMLLNVKELTALPRQRLSTSQAWMLFIAAPLSVSISNTVACAIEKFLLTCDRIAFTNEPTNVEALVNFVNYRFLDIQVFSELLYTHYSYSFMLLALLLLTAMLGAIILATSATDADKSFILSAFV